MKKYLLIVGVIISFMMLQNKVDAAPSPFNIEHLSKVKNSLGRLGSFARQIADERVNRAMDRSLDTDSVSHWLLNEFTYKDNIKLRIFLSYSNQNRQKDLFVHQYHSS